MVQSEGQVLVRGQSVLCKFVGVLECSSCRPPCLFGFEYFNKLSCFGSSFKVFLIYWQQ